MGQLEGDIRQRSPLRVLYSQISNMYEKGQLSTKQKLMRAVCMLQRKWVSSKFNQVHRIILNQRSLTVDGGYLHPRFGML